MFAIQLHHVQSLATAHNPEYMLSYLALLTIYKHAQIQTSSLLLMDGEKQR